MAIAIMVGIGLLVGIGALSLFHFLFVKPKIEILKSQYGDNGFAFSFLWDQELEPYQFDLLKIKLFNPFGTPVQMEITREFDSARKDFARDLNLGLKMKEFFFAKGLENSIIEIDVSSTKNNITHQISMKGNTFLEKYKKATVTAEEKNQQFSTPPKKALFVIPAKSFISPSLSKTNKVLKIATNPEFTEQFSKENSGTKKEGAPASAFLVTKVWIEPGCIVCNACEGIIPEVFEVADESCFIRPNAPLDAGLKIKEAAEACPVGVIKFIKAS